ncbi:MAG: hypothetical protein PHG65_03300 [Kiritimatiellae bacterium]|nr:hypothetical protein [Kiritimatiellia bacterium]
MMTDPDAMFTLTGVIATILSVFFAIAAFIVRLRGKKQTASSKIKAENTKVVLEAHEVPHLPPPEQILARQEAEMEPAAPVSPPRPAGKTATAHRQPTSIPAGANEEIPAEEAFALPSNYFKKYSATRKTEDILPPEDKDVYAWE